MVLFAFVLVCLLILLTQAVVILSILPVVQTTFHVHIVIIILMVFCDLNGIFQIWVNCYG